MRLLEHEAKQLLRAAGVSMPEAFLVHSAPEAALAAWRLGGETIVKGQVTRGHRMHDGGVLRAAGPAEAGDAFDRVQAALATPAALVESVVDSRREVYAAVVLDPGDYQTWLLLGADGGVDVGEATVGVSRTRLDPPGALQRHQAAAAVDHCGLSSHLEALWPVLASMAQAYRDYDASLVEINPLAVDASGNAWALDAKIETDDYALFRQPELAAWHCHWSRTDWRQEDLESRGLQHVWLDGDVGVLGIGAGATMAAVDWVAGAGGRPTCFLDYAACARRYLPDLRAGSVPEALVDDLVTGIAAVRAHGAATFLLNVVSGGMPTAELTSAFLAAFQGAGFPPEGAVWVVDGNGRRDAIARLEKEGIAACGTLGEAVRAAVQSAASRRGVSA